MTNGMNLYGDVGLSVFYIVLFPFLRLFGRCMFFLLCTELLTAAKLQKLAKNHWGCLP